MNTQEGNKLIAEFMGAFPVDIGDKEGWWYLTNGLFPHGYDRIMFRAIKYHSDWNWLMEVVEKVESVYDSTFVVEITDCICEITGLDDLSIYRAGNDKKEVVYSACLHFIQWYNEQDFKDEK